MGVFRGRLMAAALGAGLTVGLAVTPAQAQWTVKVQAHGNTDTSDFSELGSSDGSANQMTTDGAASGSVTYSANKTQIHAWGSATSSRTAGQSTSSSTLADLGSASIHYYSTQSGGAANRMYGELDDTLRFSLPDPASVYLIPFTYTFDGTVSGGLGMDAETFFILGFADAGSNQANSANGPYQPPSFGMNEGSSWQDAAITALGDYGYRVTGLLKVGGADLGTNVAFQIRANIGCGVSNTPQQICDFGNTQKFQFGALPTGVSYTSDSGVFLTATANGGVPEPALWALVIVGFGGAGAALRGQRARRPAAA